MTLHRSKTRFQRGGRLFASRLNPNPRHRSSIPPRVDAYWEGGRVVGEMREWWQRREERVSPLLTSVKRDPPLKICARFIFTLSYIQLFFFPPLVFHSPGLYTLIYAVAHGNTRDRERERSSHNVSHNMSRRELSFPRDETPASV